MVMTVVCIAYILTGALLMFLDKDKKIGQRKVRITRNIRRECDNVIAMPTKRVKERGIKSFIS